MRGRPVSGYMLCDTAAKAVKRHVTPDSADPTPLWALAAEKG